jgi:hypothetical protein
VRVYVSGGGVFGATDKARDIIIGWYMTNHFEIWINLKML